MFVKLAGISMLFSAVQPENALNPMLVIPSEKPTSSNPVQLLNAHCPIVITRAGISMLFSAAQPEKAWLPMLVSWLLSPKVTLVIPEQPENALSLMTVTPAGI